MYHVIEFCDFGFINLSIVSHELAVNTFRRFCCLFLRLKPSSWIVRPRSTTIVRRVQITYIFSRKRITHFTKRVPLRKTPPATSSRATSRPFLFIARRRKRCPDRVYRPVIVIASRTLLIGRHHQAVGHTRSLT